MTQKIPMLADAILLATFEHHGQLDAQGQPYILHPLRVMFGLPPHDEITRMVAVLHDVLEDTEMSAIELSERGYSAEVCDALKALTHLHPETYEAYVARAKKNPIARIVKAADIRDNLARMTPQFEKNRAKYEAALKFLAEE